MNISDAERLMERNYEQAKACLNEYPLPPLLVVTTCCRISSSGIEIGPDGHSRVLSEQQWKELLLFIDSDYLSDSWERFYLLREIEPDECDPWIQAQMEDWGMNTRCVYGCAYNLTVPLWWAELVDLHDSLRYPIMVAGNSEIIDCLRKRGVENSFDSLDKAADYLKAYRDTEYENRTGLLPYYPPVKVITDDWGEEWELNT